MAGGETGGGAGGSTLTGGGWVRRVRRSPSRRPGLASASGSRGPGLDDESTSATELAGGPALEGTDTGRLARHPHSQRASQNNNLPMFESFEVGPAGPGPGAGKPGRVHFPEAALTPTQQVDLLQSQGLQIEDRAEAEFHLRHINYHRLRPYWISLERPGGQPRFVEGARFSTVLGRYRLDRRLRMLLLDAIERIEVSVRSRWSNLMSLRHGPLCLGRRELFTRGEVYRRNLDSVMHFYRNSDDEYAQHFRRKYPQLELPPVWICSEMMSLGQLVKWIGSLKQVRDRQGVADAYQLEEGVLVQFLLHLTEVRNLAAHHSRCWDRCFEPGVPLPRKKKGALKALYPQQPTRIYNTLVFLDYWMDLICPGNSWAHRLLEALRQFEEPLDPMGFPPDWQQRVDWFQ